MAFKRFRGFEPKCKLKLKFKPKHEPKFKLKFKPKCKLRFKPQQFKPKFKLHKDVNV